MSILSSALPPSHPHSPTPSITSSLSHSLHHILTLPLPPSHPHSPTPSITSSLSHSLHHILTLPLPPSHPDSPTPSITSSLSHSLHHILTLPPPPSHPHSPTPFLYATNCTFPVNYYNYARSAITLLVCIDLVHAQYAYCLDRIEECVLYTAGFRVECGGLLFVICIVKLFFMIVYRILL